MTAHEPSRADLLSEVAALRQQVATLEQLAAEQTSAMQRMQADASHLDTLLSHLDHHILIGDAQGRLVACNDVFTQFMQGVWGVVPQPGMPLADLFPDPTVAAWWGDLHQRVLNGETFCVTHSFTVLGGVLDLEFSYHPIATNGVVTGFTEIAQDVTDLKRAERIQSALFTIAQSANRPGSLSDLLATAHEQLGRLLDATNFYIALYDPEQALYTFPYWVDTVDQDFTPQPLTNSPTDYVRRTGEPLLLDQQDWVHYAEHHAMINYGPPGPIWLGAPLRTPEGVIGVVAVQSYQDQSLYSTQDLELLAVIAEHIAAMIEHKHAQDALAQERNLLSTVVNNLPVAIYAQDREGRFIFGNKTVLDTLRLPSMADFLGKTVMDFNAAELAQEHQADDAAVLRNGQPVLNKEYTGDDPAGVQQWSLISKLPLHDTLGAITGLVVLVQDITARKQTEAALRQEHDLVMRIMDTSPVGIVVVDRSGQLTFANQQAEQVLNLSPDQHTDLAYNAPDWQITAYDGSPFPDEALPFQRVMATGQPVYDVQHAIQRPDGRRVLLSINAAPLFTADGQLDGMVSTVEDVTERILAAEQARKAAERERELERRYRNIVDAIPLGIHMYEIQADNQLVFIGTNPAADRILGFDNQQLLGLTIEEAFPSITQTGMVQIYRTVALSGEPWQSTQVDYQDQRIQGAFEIYAFRPSPGRVTVLFHDVTERKEAEQAIRYYTKRLEHLHEIDRAILTAASQEEISAAALLHAQTLLRCNRASVIAFDPPAPAGQVLAAYPAGSSEQPSPPCAIQTWQSLAPQLWHGEPLLALNLDTLTASEPFYTALATAGVHSYAALPLMSHGNLIGLFTLGSASPSGLAGEQIEIALEIANPLAIAIRQARLLTAEQEQRQLAEALRDVTAVLTSTLSQEEVMARILDTVGRVVPHDAANIMLLQDGEAWIVGRKGYAERGLDAAVLRVRYSLPETINLLTMYETQQGLIIPDIPAYNGWVGSHHTEWMRSYVGSPIRLDGQVIGFLNLDSATPDFFTAIHAERLQAFADQAAVAIRNAKLYRAEQKRRHLADTLREAAAALNSTLELDNVLDLILQRLRTVIAYDSASIQRLDGEQMVIMAGQGFPNDAQVIGMRFPLVPSFPNAQVATQAEPLAVVDVTQDYPHFQADAPKYESGHIRSWLGVPMQLKGQMIGMIALDRVRVDPYTEEDVAWATAFANQAAIAIENARLHQDMRERAVRLELVSHISQRTTAILDLDRLLREAVELISDVFNYYYTSVLLVEDGALVLRAASLPEMQSFEGKSKLPMDRSSITTSVVTEGRAILVGDVRQDPRYVAIFADRSESISELAVPIRLRDEIVGVLNTESAAPNAFSQSDLMTLQTIADQLATALHNARLYEQVQQHADELETRVAMRTAELQAANTHLQQLSRIKDEFVTNVSHELRTPISSLKLYHHLLVHKPENYTVYMERLQRETDRLARIIEDLLLLSRLEQQHEQLKLKTLNLNQLVRPYIIDRQLLAESLGLRLLFDGAPSLPPVHVDEGLIGQVVSILITNALHYTPAGGQVTVSTHRRKENGQRWAGFSVTDTGPGIPPDEQKRLFERFFRGQAGQESGSPGTGLGLSIAREIVERHAGTIAASSVPGQGASFTVWLPAAPEKVT